MGLTGLLTEGGGVLGCEMLGVSRLWIGLTRLLTEGGDRLD